MKNTIAFNENLNMTLVSSTDDGSNTFFIAWNCDLLKNPVLTVADSQFIPTSANFNYEIPQSVWTGSGSFDVTVASNGASQTFTVNQIEELGNVMLQKNSDIEFTLLVAKTSNDISDKTVDIIQNITEQFPEIEAGDRVSEVVGKIKKYLEDVKENGGKPPKMFINSDGHLIAVYE